MNSAEPKLRECPFCGGEAELRVASEIWNGDGSVSIGGWKVSCTECDIETYLESRETAIEKWNRRVSDAE